MLHTVTGARIVGTDRKQRNQTSGESIGLTSEDVASLFLKFFMFDLENGIWLANSGGTSLHMGDVICFRSFLSVISVTCRFCEDYQLEQMQRRA
ncbi:hypothetical protein CO704_06255 [Cedecea neteri]|uniref:Uncharacterized protein n=1 Tax=Cedecea neteri TaxID=158822 RepID=A0A291E503_9ENTR|nr:hypothetical protein CO704_06255 [Cedecea neteri]